MVLKLYFFPLFFLMTFSPKVNGNSIFFKPLYNLLLLHKVQNFQKFEI